MIMFVGLQGSGKTTTCTKVSKVLHVYFLLPETTFTSPEKRILCFAKFPMFLLDLFLLNMAFQIWPFVKTAIIRHILLLLNFPVDVCELLKLFCQ